MEAAWATQQTRTFLGAKFWSLAGRKGKKKAIVAIAHKILVIAYYVLLTGEPYKEIGQDFLDKRRKVSKEDHYINYLKKHGYDITAKPEDAKVG